jgi:Fe2+ or Zn2+ uptake regulation protein
MITIKKKGLPRLRESRQRKVVYAHLLGTRAHPTAAAVYAGVRTQMPGLSLGTVYRNLAVLKAQGKIRELAAQGAQARFDADIKPHAHFYCRKCNGVYDLPMTSAAARHLGRLAAAGHEVEVLEVYLQGVCEHCRAKRRR